MLFLSVYSSKGNMLSTPSPLSLSALSPSVSPTSSLPMAWGNSWLSECSSPFVSTHWLALRSPKSRAAWGAGSQLSAGAAQKKSEGKKNEGLKIIRRLHRNLSRYVCSLSACLSCCNENQWGLSHFPHVFFVKWSAIVLSTVCTALSFSSTSFSSPLPCWFPPSFEILFVDQTPLLSLQCCHQQVTHNPITQQKLSGKPWCTGAGQMQHKKHFIFHPMQTKFQLETCGPL